jgi:anaerobic selenocysteine-containing dehydrogenase
MSAENKKSHIDIGDAALPELTPALPTPGEIVNRPRVLAMPEIRSYCRICIAGCGTLVNVEDKQVISVKGDPEHPLSHGYLCPKGRALGDLHHDPARISGAFVGRAEARVAVDHSTAIADAASALKRVIAEHGPESVGFFLGSGGFIDPAGALAARKFRRRLGTNQNYSTATVDSIAKVMVTSMMAGTTALVPHLDPAAELVVFVGSNPVVSHGQSTGFPDPIQRLREINEIGGEIWVIDPRRTETAAHAAHHLAARPGTDYALFAFLVRDVLNRRPDVGVDLDVDALSLSVAPFDAETAASITGLSVPDIQQLADAIEQRGRVAVITGTGNTMSVTGNLTEWLSWALMILTDSFEKPGGMWFNPGYITRLDERPVLPATPPMPSSPELPSAVNSIGEWPASLLPHEIESGRLRALVVFGCNVVTALPDTDQLEKALDQLDALIVLDLFDNETGGHATHLFACPDQLERADLPALDIYIAARATHYTPSVIDPPADRPPAWRTIAEIAWAMGIDLLGDPSTLTTDDVLSSVARSVSMDDLRAADGAMLIDEEAVYDWAIERLPNGGWDLAPEPLVAQLSDDLAVQLASISSGGSDGSLLLTPRRQLRRENARAYRDGELMEAWLHPDDAADRAIANGDEITVESATGSLRVPVLVTDRIRPGVISLPHGYSESNVNNLVSGDDVDALSGMPRMSGTRVHVRRPDPALAG